MSKPGTTKDKPKRPWRDNLEAFGVAILAAVLLKPMIIEAYQIPTSSMQPTLMGSAEAGVYDRILVDKLRYEIFEPKRWDIVVFRYPIRRNQNYVKRLAGMPGDRLRIAGGNLWHVGEDGEVDHVLRKPDRIQRGLWKEIYPARTAVGSPGKVLNTFFSGAIGKWSEDGTTLKAEPSSSGRTLLTYLDTPNRGLSNQVYDGYPGFVARAIRQNGGAGAGGSRGVQDARMAFTLTAERPPTVLRMKLDLRPAAHSRRTYELVVKDGQARLRVKVAEEERAVSEPVPCALEAGGSTRLAFAHIDDRLLGWIDGEQVLEVEVGTARVLHPLETGQVTLSVETEGGGGLAFGDVKVERDLHYVPTGLEDDLENLVKEGEQALLNHVIEIPEGHYMMLGDNTLASADSRQWLVVSIGATPDGWMVDPTHHAEDQNVRLLKGNRRPWGLEEKPDNDENPVVVRSRTKGEPDMVAFTDDDGQVYALKTFLAPNYSPGGMHFQERNGVTRTWQPPEEHVYFVPREHILGRPVLGFWPLFSPFRLGFIR